MINNYQRNYQDIKVGLVHSQVAEESGCRNAYDLKTCVIDASKTNPGEFAN